MKKFFCDKCGLEAYESQSASRSFQSLHMKYEGDWIGFEIIPTHNGVMDREVHVCDECFPQLLLQAVKTFAQSQAVTAQEAAELESKAFNLLKPALKKQLAAALEREREANHKMTEAHRYVMEANSQRLRDAETIVHLQQLVNALNLKIETERNREDFNEKQHDLDIENNPDYKAAISRRERIKTNIMNPPEPPPPRVDPYAGMSQLEIDMATNPDYAKAVNRRKKLKEEQVEQPVEEEPKVDVFKGKSQHEIDMATNPDYAASVTKRQRLKADK